MSCAGMLPCTILTTLMMSVLDHQTVCLAPLADRLDGSDLTCSKPRSMPIR